MTLVRKAQSAPLWEGRFKSQALLDESVLAACIVCVDLSPVRAGVAKISEASLPRQFQKRLDKAWRTV